MGARIFQRRRLDKSRRARLSVMLSAKILSFASEHANWEPSRYFNNVTGECQSNSPPQFRGGILADQMGLGKTLQMIALIASDVAKIRPIHHVALKEIKLLNTLVVVPFPCKPFRGNASEHG